MGNVAVKIKIMPKSIDTNLDLLKEKIIEKVSNKASIYGNIEQQPIAFGLKALILTVLVDDCEGGVEFIEKEIMDIEDAESIQILELGRI